jgi:Cu+-exporting ATPase
MQVTDPVCSMTIESEKAAACEVWRGQTYYLCSKSCLENFRAAPDRYARKPDNGTTSARMATEADR